MNPPALSQEQQYPYGHVVYGGWDRVRNRPGAG